jgi:crotonobetainyl-CoA:carnitine CoA-transferase CaiB-like acyl-CoA transferase
MTDYNVQATAKRVLLEELVGDERLGFDSDVKAACEAVQFVGPDPKPFLPAPVAMTESISAIAGLVGAAASVVARDRYGVSQDVTVET